ncbi:MAG: hypothetical protein JXO72_02760 [Vicinamibacteria bacterium]|nr:hypothetical protein [Vicinamibacteria bacterium]
MSFQSTATRVWKKLTLQERLAAALRFWEAPPEESLAGALSAIVKARKLRPQVARALPLNDRARYLCSILEPGESVAVSLLIALHLGERRPLLVAFLDALALPHEDGVLKDEAFSSRPTVEQAQEAVRRLAEAFPSREIEIYLNTLWLQDPEHWHALGQSHLWLSRPEDPPATPDS